MSFWRFKYDYTKESSTSTLSIVVSSTPLLVDDIYSLIMGSKRHGHVCALLQKLQIMTLNYMTFLKSVNELNKTMALFLSIIVESDIMTIVTSVIISYYIYKERERERE